MFTFIFFAILLAIFVIVTLVAAGFLVYSVVVLGEFNLDLVSAVIAGVLVCTMVALLLGAMKRWGSGILSDLVRRRPPR